MTALAIAGTEHHPQARMALATALANGPSHAYLFHGPAGVGKAAAARGFAAELLAEGAADPDGVRGRVARTKHPDLTWVEPTGAHGMRVDDVDVEVVKAAFQTPFEAARRVFVLEGADTMNDQVANRLLKTLEEPAPFVHLVLLTDALGQVIETVVSRCQLVRFNPLRADLIAAALEREGVPGERVGACSRLALGNGSRARLLASDEGTGLRADVAGAVEAALAGAGAANEPWKPLLTRAEQSKGEVTARVQEKWAERLASEPRGRNRSAIERRCEDEVKREIRRAKTEVIDLGLTLAALTFRDLVCIEEGAEEAALDAEGARPLAERSRGIDPRRLRAAAERCEQTRLSLSVNVTEELALEALGFRLARLVGAAAPG